ncbi:MAG: RNA methyltransferase [Calditrichaeota bacterium]|nr:MAG: RNA methyltransferase [Calditrichota bacterium]
MPPKRAHWDNIHFVLVEPQHPGNIGASVRALKTMGFDRLVLVNPAPFDVPEARWMAHASEDLFDQIKVVSTLAEAVSDKHFVVGTTQRTREFHLPYFTPKQLAERLIPMAKSHQVAIVFGREATGLTNEELAHCHAISTIPAATSHPSLNLSQAVMVYAYELYNFVSETPARYRYRLASHQELEALKKHLRQSLEQVGFEPMDNWDNFLMRFQRFFGRAMPEVRDVRLMHKILQAFDEYIARNCPPDQSMDTGSRS